MERGNRIGLTVSLLMLWNGLFVYSDYLILGKVNWYSPFISPIFFMIAILLTERNETRKLRKNT